MGLFYLNLSLCELWISSLMDVFFLNLYVVSTGYQGCNSCHLNNRDLCKIVCQAANNADSKWIPHAKDERLAHGH